MASFVIEGGHKLHGEIHPQGAKNEVLQILCATLLTSEEVTVNNIPDILDVNNLIQLLREMGGTLRTWLRCLSRRCSPQRLPSATSTTWRHQPSPSSTATSTH